MTEERIIESILRGINFLAKRQLSSGEFSTLRWRKSNVQAASYVKSVFITSFVLHSLAHLSNFSQVQKISQRAIRFLLDEMEQSGLWRFLGKKSYIHFDVDTTCCILASLREWRINLDYYSVASLLLKNRNNRGIFNTWILDIDPPFEKGDNNIDWVVNANVLFFYSLLDWPLSEVEEYLIQIVRTGQFMQKSVYYDSPFSFVYCLTRIYSDAGNKRLEPIVKEVKTYLLNCQTRGTGDKTDPLESTLAITGLLNCGVQPSNLTQVIECLLHMQREDEGWPIGTFFVGGPYLGYDLAFGSREVTTAIAVEALSKYARTNR